MPTLKQPLRKDDAWLAEVAAYRARTPLDSARAPLVVWWLGQSGFLLAWQNQFVLLDPYLSDSLTRKYAGTDKPHDRISARVVDPARLDFLAAVTSSHNHTDHLDPETLKPLVAANPELVMVCPEANRVTVRERCGLPDHRILGLDHGWPRAGALQFVALPRSPFRFHAIPAAHENLDRDAGGRLVYLGFVVEFGPFRVYHSGDTVPFDGLPELLRPLHLDLALLPINGRAPERRVAGNLWGHEAARLAKAAGARCVVPCHYDMFEFNTASPDEFAAECQRLGQPHRVLQQGEALELGPRPTP